MVSTIIGKIIPFKFYIIGALVLSTAALIGYKFYQVSQLENKLLKKDAEIKTYDIALAKTGRALNDVLISNKQKDTFIKTQKENFDKDIKRLNQMHQEQLKREIKITTIKGEIKNVKKSDDAITAPVLTHTIDSLFKLTKSH